MSIFPWFVNIKLWLPTGYHDVNIMLAAGRAISVAQPHNTSESPCLCIWKMQKVFILPQRSPGEADPVEFAGLMSWTLAADDTQLYSNVFIFPILQRIPNV